MKIVILESLGLSKEILDESFSSLKEAGHSVQIHFDRQEDPAILIARCKDAEIVVLSNIPFPKTVIEECHSLKLIAVAFTGVDHVDMDFCHKRGISVCNAAGYSTTSVAELTLGMILALFRKIIPLNTKIRKEGTRKGLIGQELKGKIVGVIGTGLIGTQVIHLLHAFGCEVIAYSRTQKPDLIALDVQYVNLETLLRKSDVITLHIPLNSTTHHLLNSSNLDLMKSSAILINCARGPIVDYKYLAKMLSSGKLAGAALDVFESEPPIPSDHPLFHVPNVIVTPHIAFATIEAFKNRIAIVKDNIIAWLNGNPTNIIN